MPSNRLAPRPQHQVCSLAVLALALALSGCSSRPTPATVTAADLSKIGLAYHSFVDVRKSGPSQASDLAPFFAANAVEQSALQKLRDGEVVFHWNVSLQEMSSSGPSTTVLAYAKNVPQSGGLVLFGSSEVRTLTATEFAAAPKAVPRAK